VKKDLSSLRLTIGPLRYQFVAYDNWGERTLGKLRRHIDCVSFRGLPHRVLHLAKLRLWLGDRPRLASSGLPERLADFLKRGVPRKGWEGRSDHTGHFLWMHPRSAHSVWTFGLETPHQESVYQLPWYLILEDMVHLAGGVLHAGMAVLEGRCYLFTAPPGGGKTTALSRIPSPWEVVSDDTALIWPEGDGVFRASPLPTWSALIGVKKTMPSIPRWEVGRSVPVGGLILLKKSKQLRLTLLPAHQAAPHLYRALSEYPAVLVNRDSFRKELFRAACAVARGLPLWELEKPRDGNFWGLLQDGISAVKEKQPKKCS
jgi:hypothetical protein